MGGRASARASTGGRRREWWTTTSPRRSRSACDRHHGARAPAPRQDSSPHPVHKRHRDFQTCSSPYGRATPARRRTWSWTPSPRDARNQPENGFPADSTIRTWNSHPTKGRATSHQSTSTRLRWLKLATVPPSRSSSIAISALLFHRPVHTDRKGAPRRRSGTRSEDSGEMSRRVRKRLWSQHRSAQVATCGYRRTRT